jgi:hypothetical protein
MRAKQQQPAAFFSQLFQLVQEAALAVELLGLEVARHWVQERLAGLQAGGPATSHARRRLLDAQTKDEFLRDLLSVATDLACQQLSMNGPARRWPRPIVASTLDRVRLTIVPADSILYAFVSHAAAAGMIEAPWRHHELQPRRVHLRTVKDLLVTHHRSLAQLQDWLDPQVFMAIHQSLRVNVHRISGLDVEGSLKRLVVTPASRVDEWLTISRRHFAELRKRLGLPRRFTAGD